ncbi:alpha/beta fold hydrolase [Glaciecola sp. SC05]|uniref:alpha/beta fold hydrolase n=1 Tax=Glaciecola sp. SC05 TaxID=1987355 RepID=UPI003527F936
MVDTQLEEITLLNGRISALQSGKGKSSPLLFVHGYLDNANSFAEIIPLLPSYHCVAIDLPGHGKSAHRSLDAHYHLSDYVHDLYCLISENSWNDVTLVGHSLGGILSTILAACFPELIKQVISIESFGPLTEPEFTSTKQLRQSMISRQLADKPIKQPESLASIVASRLRVSDMQAAHAELILTRNTELVNGQLQWRTDKRLRTKSALRLSSSQALDLLENIQCPYHVVLGSEGFKKVKRLFTHRSTIFKQLHCIELAGGHHVHMEQTEAIATYIENTLKSH